MDTPVVRIFVSSPGDVGFERRVALNVIERLRGEFRAHFDIQALSWENQPLLATQHFQQQIASTAEVDIAVFVLWTRLGTLLPDSFARDDGSSYASGTEFEFETAAAAFRANGKPAMLAYLKRAERAISLTDRAAAMQAFSQKEALDQFVDRWFGNPESAFRAAFKSFDGADEFERMLESDLRQLLSAHLEVGAHERGPQATWSRGSPFLGLSSFGFDHAPVFFGRTRAIYDLRAALIEQAARDCAFVLLLGMSGCGKSSLVHAGLIPALLQPGVVEGVDLWRWCSMRPSGNQQDLLLGLAATILRGIHGSPDDADTLTAESLAALMRQSPTQASAEIARSLQRAGEARAMEHGLTHAPATRLIVVIDQFEEVFLLDEIADKAEQEIESGAQARTRFVDMLEALARSGQVWVIATLRSDFYFRCAEVPALVRLKEGAGQYELLPPTRSEFEQIVRSAAAAAGLRFERDSASGSTLDETLIEASATNPAALPLLEFALDELYRRRTHGGMLSLAAYHDFGGIEGAISRRAEQTYTALEPACQAKLPEVFARLITVRLDESLTASAIRVPRTSFSAEPAVVAVLDAFIAARLFASDQTVGGEATISIVHEALFRHWPRLARWIADNQAFLETRAQFEIEAQQWRLHERDPRRLIAAGEPLDTAEDFLAQHAAALPQDVRDHIGASTRLRRSQGKYLWLGAGILVSLSSLAALTGALLWPKPQGFKVDQFLPGFAIAVWLLFVAHLRWRAQPRRVAQRKTLIFTLLIAVAFIVGIGLHMASGIEPAKWRSDMITNVGSVMFVVYGTHVALDRLSVASNAIRARRRRRFWAAFVTVSALAFAFLPTKLMFTGAARDSTTALLLLLAGALSVLLVAHPPPLPRTRGKAVAAGPMRPPSDPIADGILALLVLGLMMTSMPLVVDYLRTSVELCGDIEGFFDTASLRCSAPPRPGFASVRLERETRGRPVRRMQFVDGTGNCEPALPLPPKLQFIRELGLIESGLGFSNYCSSEFDYDSSGQRSGETLFDKEGKRLMHVSGLEDTQSALGSVVYLYGSSASIYIGRFSRPPYLKAGQNGILAEFNPHHVSLGRKSPTEAMRPTPARLWEFDAHTWPVRITHVDDTGRPVQAAPFQYASVNLRYAANGDLLQAEFFDTQGRYAAQADGSSMLGWDYDAAGACVKRSYYAPDGHKLKETDCRNASERSSE